MVLGFVKQAYGQATPVVDADSLEKKVLVGYQGWFTTPQDGSRSARWRHYFENNDPGDLGVDFWPDVTEYNADLLYDTGYTLNNGRPARVFSSYDPATVRLHFEWMRTYKIDGVFIGRFMKAISTTTNVRDIRDRILAHARTAAEQTGRVFAVNSDISDGNGGNWLEELVTDWQGLVESGITSSYRYLHENGKPVIKIFGVGFDKSQGFTAPEALALLERLRKPDNSRYQAYVIGGVPWGWRDLSGQSRTDEANGVTWTDVYKTFDAISPWSVNAFQSIAGADTFRRNRLEPDAAKIRAWNTQEGTTIRYMPTLWPGFSWGKLREDTTVYNAAPRLGGQFIWRQAYNAIKAGSDALLIAQFDEMDEGTQIFKVAATQAEVPRLSDGLQILCHDADGAKLAVPSDWYLQLAEQISAMQKGRILIQQSMPITSPALHSTVGETVSTEHIP